MHRALQSFISVCAARIKDHDFCDCSSCLCAQAVDFVNQRLDLDLAARTICAEILDFCLAKNPKEARGIGCDNMTAELVVFK